MGCFIGRLCAGNFQLSIVKNNKNQGGCKKMSYQEIYKKWCTDPYFDAQTQEELKKLEGNEKEIEDRFYRQLEFGTGGLRGMIGAGTNRTRALPLPTIPVSCHRSLQERQRSA